MADWTRGGWSDDGKPVGLPEHDPERAVYVWVALRYNGKRPWWSDMECVPVHRVAFLRSAYAIARVHGDAPPDWWWVPAGEVPGLPEVGG